MAQERVSGISAADLVTLLSEQPEDTLKELLQLVAQAATQAQFDEQIGAAPFERSEGRRGWRNGSRNRRFDTRLGSLQLEIPRPRDGGFQPSFLEHRKRSERALVSTVLEAVINGVSTRKIERLLGELGVRSMSKSQVSSLCSELDDKVKAFRERPLTLAYPYLMLDALYEKARIDGKVIAQAVVVAYAVSELGFREVIGVDVVETESRESWTHFLRGLMARGLHGVKLVVSDAHQGLKAAIGAVLSGAAWQRCRVHLMRNVLAHVPQSRKAEIAAAVRGCFEQPDAAAATRQAQLIVERYRKSCSKAMEILAAGIDDALSFFAFPLEHHRRLWSTNPVEHLNREIRRRTRCVGIFPNAASALRLITMILIEQTEEWTTERRYLSEDSMQQLVRTKTD
jgi:transposase-like protein